MKKLIFVLLISFYCNAQKNIDIKCFEYKSKYNSFIEQPLTQLSCIDFSNNYITLQINDIIENLYINYISIIKSKRTQIYGNIYNCKDDNNNTVIIRIEKDKIYYYKKGIYLTFYY